MRNVFLWLDASPAHYWSAAWCAFALALAWAVAAWRAPRDRGGWRHPAIFPGLMLLTVGMFRWPVLLENRQIADPDESQLIAGALTLRHDPMFWRSVDGTTHGPLAQWPLLVPHVAGKALDFTTARTMSALLAWAAIVGAWLVFRHLFGPRRAGVLVLPLLATTAFTHAWSFAAFCSEHAPAALIAVGSAVLLTAWDSTGVKFSLRRFFCAGITLGAVPLAKLQGAPIGAFALLGGVALIGATHTASWRERRRALLWLSLGTAVVPAIILAMVLGGGIWMDFWQCYIQDNLRYAGGRWFTWAETPAKLVELCGITEGFVEYLFWIAGLGACALLGAPWFTSWQRRTVVFSAGLLLAAAYATMAPGRLFAHYVQLMTFPAGLFGGMVVGALLTKLDDAMPRFNRARAVPAIIVVLFLVAGLLPQILWRARDSQPFLGRYTDTHGALQRSAVAEEILRHAQPGERLGIWGWMPTFWVETGLIQGTRDGNDARQIEPSPQRDYYRARFLGDLQRNRPRVFIDAVGGDNLMYHDRAASAHETFPELRDSIARDYQLVRDLDGTRIYVRREKS